MSTIEEFNPQKSDSLAAMPMRVTPSRETEQAVKRMFIRRKFRPRLKTKPRGWIQQGKPAINQ